MRFNQVSGPTLFSWTVTNDFQQGTLKMQRLNVWHAVLTAVFAFLLNVQQHNFAQAHEPAIRSVTDLERIPVGIKVVQSPEMANAVKKLPVDERRGGNTRGSIGRKSV